MIVAPSGSLGNRTRSVAPEESLSAAISFPSEPAAFTEEAALSPVAIRTTPGVPVGPRSRIRSSPAAGTSSTRRWVEWRTRGGAPAATSSAIRVTSRQRPRGAGLEAHAVADGEVGLEHVHELPGELERRPSRPGRHEGAAAKAEEARASATRHGRPALRSAPSRSGRYSARATSGSANLRGDVFRLRTQPSPTAAIALGLRIGAQRGEQVVEGRRVARGAPPERGAPEVVVAAAKAAAASTASALVADLESAIEQQCCGTDEWRDAYLGGVTLVNITIKFGDLYDYELVDIKIGGFSNGVAAAEAIIGASDPPLPKLRFSRYAPHFGSEVARAARSAPATLPAGTISANLSTASLSLLGGLESNWSALGRHALEFASLTASNGVVSQPGGVLGSGAISASAIMSSATALSDSPSPLSIAVAGDGGVGLYAPAASGLAGGSQWLDYTAQLSSFQPYTLRLEDAAVTVGGDTFTGTLDLALSVPATVAGAGRAAAPTFAASAQATLVSGGVMVSPASGSLDGGRRIDQPGQRLRPGQLQRHSHGQRSQRKQRHGDAERHGQRSSPSASARPAPASRPPAPPASHPTSRPMPAAATP